MASCACIKGNYDFYIKVVDSQTLIYNDLSEWMTDEPYITPSEHEVLITLPSSAVIKTSVKARSVTVLKASDIGIPKFKDGIYCFTIDALSEESGGCGLSYSKSVGVFPNLECCLHTGFSKLGDEKYDELKRVESWLNRAEQSSQLGMEKQALDEWKAARSFLSKLNCECNNC